jgi:hypothetical protein
MRPAWPLVVLCWHLVASAAARHQDTHNPLERINVAAASVQQDNQIKLAVSTTKLTKREGELVEVRGASASVSQAALHRRLCWPPATQPVPGPFSESCREPYISAAPLTPSHSHARPYRCPGTGCSTLRTQTGSACWSQRAQTPRELRQPSFKWRQQTSMPHTSRAGQGGCGSAS